MKWNIGPINYSALPSCWKEVLSQSFISDKVHLRMTPLLLQQMSEDGALLDCHYWNLYAHLPKDNIASTFIQRFWMLPGLIGNTKTQKEKVSQNLIVRFQKKTKTKPNSFNAAGSIYQIKHAIRLSLESVNTLGFADRAQFLISQILRSLLNAKTCNQLKGITSELDSILHCVNPGFSGIFVCG